MGSRTFDLISAFNAGEWSPRLNGQVDLKKYSSACRILENFILFPHGGAQTRPGFRFIAAAKNAGSKCRLTPFVYSNEQAYVLEWGDEYLRFFMDQGQIVSSGSPVEIVTPYAAADLPLLQFAQSADILYCVHRLYAPRKLARYSHTSWAISSMDLVDGPWRDINVNTEKYITPLGSVGTKGATIDLYGGIASTTSEDTSVFNNIGTLATISEGVYAGLSVGNPNRNGGIKWTAPSTVVLNKFRVYTLEFVNEGAIGVNAKVYSEAGVLLATASGLSQISAYGSDEYDGGPYGLTQGYIWEFTFATPPTLESGSTYFIVLEATEVEGSTAYVRLCMVADTSGCVTYSGTSAASILNETATDMSPYELMFNMKTTDTETSGGVEIWDPKHVGALWRLKHSGNSVTKEFTAADQYSSALLLRGKFLVDLTPYTPVTTDDGEYWTGEIVLQCSTDQTYWEDVGSFFYSTMQEFFEGNSNVYYRLKCKTFTRGKATGTLSQAEHWGTVKISEFISATHVKAEVLFPLNADDPTLSWREGAWSDYRGWPRTVVFHDDRLWFARDDFLWSSWSGDYENFTPGDTDASPITFELTQIVNPLEWIASHTQFLCGSIGEEAKVWGGTDKPITAKNVNVKVQSTHGTAQYPRPIRVGPNTFFIQAARRKLEAMAYDFSNDAFKAADLTLMAEHISLGGLFDFAWQQEPDSILWTVRGDGVLPGLTYYQDQDVIGWHRQVTDGVFESVTTIPSSPGSEEGYDELWAVVNRTIGGNTVRYIEVMENHQTATALKDYFCVDSGLTYEGTAVSSVSGLNHLEGKTVAILADGVVADSQVVSSGAVALKVDGETITASTVHAGLPYTCTLETMDLEPRTQDGTAQSRRKQIPRVTLRLLKSVGGKAGPSDDYLQEIPYPTAGALYTGDAEITWPQSDNNGRVKIVQSKPLPLTVLAAMPMVMVND